MSVSINVFILLNSFLIACLAPNFMHHKGIYITNFMLEITSSFRIPVLQPSIFDVLGISKTFIQPIHTSNDCSFKHPSMKMVRVGIKRGWTILFRMFTLQRELIFFM